MHLVQFLLDEMHSFYASAFVFMPAPNYTCEDIHEQPHFLSCYIA